MATAVDKGPAYRRAWLLVGLFGLISLCSDLVYQAGRSINGPYLAELGADAALVGLVAGIAEFLGYALRLVTGHLVDRSRAYWAFTLGGYALVAAVPLMALAGTWQTAALFIVLERLSKAVRAPAKDTLLSMAAKRIGTGRGFAVHKFLDQTGAVLGPLLVSLFLSGAFGHTFQGLVSYQQAYALLWIPLGLVFLAALFGQNRVPNPAALEAELAPAAASPPPPDKLTRTFWIYSLFTLLSAFGFVSFALLSFHAKTTALLADPAIPLWYAAAMGAGALAALVAGWLYDRWRFRVLLSVPLAAAPLPFLGFLIPETGSLVTAILLYGISLGIQETIIKAGIADLTPLSKRGAGYGLFNTLNGLGLLASGAVLGWLYTISLWALCWTALAANLVAAGILLGLLRDGQNRNRGQTSAQAS